MNNKDLLYEFGETLKKEIIQQHLKAGQRASGRTIEAFEVEADETTLILSGPSWVRSLEDGRKPGKQPPVSAIEQWIRDKGIKTNNPKSLAWAITKKIGRVGTRLFREGGRKDIISNVINNERIDNELTGVLQFRYATLIQEEVLEMFNK